MKTWSIPVIVEVQGHVRVEAETFLQALVLANQAPLPLIKKVQLQVVM